jgi:hypothetical protein
MRIGRLVTLALFILLGAVPAAGGTVTSAPDAERGKHLARLCTNCHLVGDLEQRQANVDVPSFSEIANKQGQTAGSIMAHVVLPKHPMPVISLTKPELADLAAYILSLRDEEAR